MAQVLIEFLSPMYSTCWYCKSLPSFLAGLGHFDFTTPFTREKAHRIITNVSFGEII
uniref:Uncharacterized protein n=1 Tax=Anguilla anguilla TaxID=7936 RepID=A0A0E9UTL4_ANGAN